MEERSSMPDLSAAMQWWEESQLRALVLSSTALQLFLFFTATKRALRIPSWLRWCIWLAYLGSDTVAIYALATLFNRHKVADGGGGSILEILWAPVLLVHLGGPVSISAYNIEDNELWRRHVLTLLSQVSVALYVFCKSWTPSGERRQLLRAAALLFTVGIIRFGMKPWALKRASIKSLALSVASLLGSRKVFKFMDVLSWLCAVCTSDTFLVMHEVRRRRRQDQQASRRGQEEAAAGADHQLEADSLDEYVRKAKILNDTSAVMAHSLDEHEKEAGMVKSETYYYVGRPETFLLADNLVSYSTRLDALRSFLALRRAGKSVYAELEAALSKMFTLLYTKRKVSMTLAGKFLWCLTVALSYAAIGLFAKAPKDGYRESDVKVTYTLLCSIAAMDLLQLCTFGCLTYCGAACSSRGTITVPQHNIMSFITRKKRPTRRMMLAAVIGWDDYANRHWHVGHQSSYSDIITRVLIQVQDGWKESIHDATSFRKFSDRRGLWTLSRRRHQQVFERCGRMADIRRSLCEPFNKSFLLWHIATDLCFYHRDATPTSESAAASRVISNYMAYLLLLRPDMLIPGTTTNGFTLACYEVEAMLRFDEEPPLHEKGLAQTILGKELEFSWVVRYEIRKLREARRLADALMELRGEEERWRVIEGVWLEMLCYSASMCRGYLHAKSLGQGSELLSYVWLLLAWMGMDTFANRLQRSDSAEEDKTAGGGWDI